jgi:hypothetical protein
VWWRRESSSPSSCPKTKLRVVMVGSSLSVVEEGVLKSLFLSRLKSLDYNAARHGAHTIFLLINNLKMIVNTLKRWIAYGK